MLKSQKKTEKLLFPDALFVVRVAVHLHSITSEPTSTNCTQESRKNSGRKRENRHGQSSAGDQWKTVNL